MLRRYVVAAVLVVCAIWATGCGTTITTSNHPGKTPTGVPCTGLFVHTNGSTAYWGCFYYISKGIPTACTMSGSIQDNFDFCSNTKGSYYGYDIVYAGSATN